MTTAQDSLVAATPDQGRTVSVVAVAAGWAGVELWGTRSGMFHLSRTNGKPMMCGRKMLAGLEEVYDTAAELAAMINEPANAKYLCSYCARNARRTLPPNVPAQPRDQ